MTSSPRFHKFKSLGPHGFHSIAYTEWGDPRNSHLVICVHGLTRNSRDFDVLAARLSRSCRVVCMDVAGRGQSSWLEHKEDYGFNLYVSDAAALMARVTAPPPQRAVGRLMRRLFKRGEPRIDWVGTSMGGLIGMMLAAKPGTPVRRLVLNDVGPLVPWRALVRLKNLHSREQHRFTDLTEAEKHLREACAAFGPLDNARWREIAKHSTRRLDDGGYALAFDPGIITALRHGGNSEVRFGGDFLLGFDLWPVWNAIKGPVLALRGGESDLLTAAIAERMQKSGPKARLAEFPGIGHAPWLMSPDQTGLVREFLLSPESSWL